MHCIHVKSLPVTVLSLHVHIYLRPHLTLQQIILCIVTSYTAWKTLLDNLSYILTFQSFKLLCNKLITSLLASLGGLSTVHKSDSFQIKAQQFPSHQSSLRFPRSPTIMKICFEKFQVSFLRAVPQAHYSTPHVHHREALEELLKLCSH